MPESSQGKEFTDDDYGVRRVITDVVCSRELLGVVEAPVVCGGDRFFAYTVILYLIYLLVSKEVHINISDISYNIEV